MAVSMDGVSKFGPRDDAFNGSFNDGFSGSFNGGAVVECDGGRVLQVMDVERDVPITTWPISRKTILTAEYVNGRTVRGRTRLSCYLGFTFQSKISWYLA